MDSTSSKNLSRLTPAVEEVISTDGGGSSPRKREKEPEKRSFMISRVVFLGREWWDFGIVLLG